MTLAEASRQYQVALECERRIRTEFHRVVSMEAEIRTAVAETRKAHSILVGSWIDALFHQSEPLTSG